MPEAAEPSFGSDLQRALVASRRFPWLPAVSVGLSAVGYVAEELVFLPLLVTASLVAAGMDRDRRLSRSDQGRLATRLRFGMSADQPADGAPLAED